MLFNQSYFAICFVLFYENPLEATAETIGSVINRHGCKERCGLLLSSISNKVQVVWNGPAEFHPDTHNLMKQSLAINFEGKATGLRFQANTRLNLMSSTISNFSRKKVKDCFQY